MYYESPMGVMRIMGDESAITRIDFVTRKGKVESTHRYFRQCCRELDQYFLGKRVLFTVPLQPTGTAFQMQVWQALIQIPFGTRACYEEIANAIGAPKAMRAVGMANANNPIPIMIPCHRVIRKDGALSGYASGVWRKEWLLRHEHALTS